MVGYTVYNLKINGDFESSGILVKKASRGPFKHEAVGEGPLRPRPATPLALNESHFEHDRIGVVIVAAGSAVTAPKEYAPPVRSCVPPMG
ncbi:hypothetical protein EVAR_40_1 [Eumeta japonica]|uniref:Uncharacterized protein n=1 Tax=Eumeta variegata TaxID=151549 RepID=A0A4C1SBB6_EUMVA|nr:hypothetical protein EVAR_40_1 [Eumeta japonica]